MDAAPRSVIVVMISRRRISITLTAPASPYAYVKIVSEGTVEIGSNLHFVRRGMLAPVRQPLHQGTRPSRRPFLCRPHLLYVKNKGSLE